MKTIKPQTSKGPADSSMVHLAIWEAPSPESGEPETKWGERVSETDGLR